MENIHIVSRYDRDIAKIKARILDMGALVAGQLKGATGALSDLDAEKTDRLIAADRKVNGMNKSIASRAERLIALRQPVALDLREALSPINIAGELERIGDHAKSTAKRAKKIASGTIPMPQLEMLQQMSAILVDQLGDVLIAYRDSDIALAATVRERDRKVDDINRAIYDLSIGGLSSAQGNAETLVNVILISRNFERVGDHIVNMARQVNQIVTGDDLKATD